MDLKAILAANKSKTERANLTRKPVDIADQDRPYSISEDEYNNAAKKSCNINDVTQEEKESVNNILDNPSIYISNQLATNKEPISNQLVTVISNQLATNKEPISNQSTKKKSRIPKNKEPISNPISNRNKEPISNQLVTQLVTAQDLVAKTSGLQRKMLFYIVEDCIFRGKLVTGYITNETFREITETNANTVKTAIQRLINKKLVKRQNGQRGKGGFSSFLITEEVREAVLKEKRNPSISNQLVTQLVTDISNQLVTNRISNKEPTISCSSSFKDLKTTTTELGDEWHFDIVLYAQFGFTKTQIKQLANSGIISAADVEQSLIEFSYDLDNNALPSIKTTKINFLMGLLWKGQAYVSEGFKNEQHAMISEMARRAEIKRKNLLEAKFGAWEASLNDDDTKKIEHEMPVRLMASYRAHGVIEANVREWMFNYFIKNVQE